MFVHKHFHWWVVLTFATEISQFWCQYWGLLGQPVYRGGAAPPGPPRQRLLQQVRAAGAGKRQQHSQVVELSTKFRGKFTTLEVLLQCLLWILWKLTWNFLDTSSGQVAVAGEADHQEIQNRRQRGQAGHTLGVYQVGTVLASAVNDPSVSQSVFTHNHREGPF